MHRVKWALMGVIATLVLVFAANGVASALGGWPGDASGQRKYAVEERAATFQRAANSIPDPRTTNFPLRRTLKEMTQREDLLHHPWYVYMLGDQGNVIGYYVAKTTPINACDFLSSTQDVYGNDQGVLSMTSPSLDGIYYGGAGGAGGCDTWVWLDAATNAEVKVNGVHWYVADQPLKIAAKVIRISGK